MQSLASVNSFGYSLHLNSTNVSKKDERLLIMQALRALKKKCKKAISKLSVWDVHQKSKNPDLLMTNVEDSLKRSTNFAKRLASGTDNPYAFPLQDLCDSPSTSEPHWAEASGEQSFGHEESNQLTCESTGFLYEDQELLQENKQGDQSTTLSTTDAPSGTTNPKRVNEGAPVPLHVRAQRCFPSNKTKTHDNLDDSFKKPDEPGRKCGLLSPSSQSRSHSTGQNRAVLTPHRSVNTLSVSKSNPFKTFCEEVGYSNPKELAEFYTPLRKCQQRKDGRPIQCSVCNWNKIQKKLYRYADISTKENYFPVGYRNEINL